MERMMSSSWEEPKKELKPRHKGAIYCEDPDTGEIVGGPSLLPETDLAKRAFEITGRRQFRSTEANQWAKIEDGVANGELPREWIASRFWCALKYNWSFPILVKAIRNEDKLRDWLVRQKR